MTNGIVRGSVGGLVIALLAMTAPLPAGAADGTPPPSTAVPSTAVPSAAGPSAAGPSSGEVRALVRARQQAVLSSEIAGRIIRLPLHEGETFRKGDRLVEFDCNALQAAQGAAKASLEHAQVRLSGLAALAAQRSAGSQEVALARIDADKARFELRAASLAVEHCVITAPFSGRVVELRAHAFETVAQGAPLLAVLDDTDLEIALVVPAAWLVWITPGQTFTLDLDETGRSHPGRITRLGAQIDSISQTLTVYGALTDNPAGLVSGMSGTVRLPRP